MITKNLTLVTIVHAAVNNQVKPFGVIIMEVALALAVNVS